MTIFSSMRRHAMALVALAAAAGWALPATATAGDAGSTAHSGFVSGFEDLPLMPGLIQVADAGTVFDTPSGRVVEAFADGPVAVEEVDAFYAETLPHLGWRRLSAHRYRREGELLDLEITARQGGDKARTTVRFYLAPD
ncbi:MAG TPA: hypothetical protein VI732_06640 [Alphaproteobacteria bacterium]|jgi:hypothetical protein|nr:hypothetical protein [Alphaproteobacteria bacterium]